MAAKSLNTEDIKGKLLQGSFMNNGPAVSQLSDPVADTPMVVTLDRLRPYEHNPRLNRNPMFDEIKASIAARGLDAPPSITRRPGEENFIIRNGGNTRLAVLNELWTETRDDQFYRINCLFRPWPTRGDIVTLTGHLAENDMKGDLTFVERALGVERAKELYEAEGLEQLSQRELVRRLAADGYTISQSHISKMQDTVQYLLPALPKVLYGGLGKPQIERLISLRSNAEKAWLRYADSDQANIDFNTMFLDVLATFDEAEQYKYERVQDELIYQMQRPLGKDYNWLKLDILEGKTPQASSPTHTPTPTQAAIPIPDLAPSDEAKPKHSERKNLPPKSGKSEDVPSPDVSHKDPIDSWVNDGDPLSTFDHGVDEDEVLRRIQENTITPISGLTPRIQSMKKQLATVTGELIPDFADSCLHSIPVQVGGMHPISDLWYIERQIDVPAELRRLIFGLAEEILTEAQIEVELAASVTGIGYVFSVDDQASSTALLCLLRGLEGSLAAQEHLADDSRADSMPGVSLGQLLLGALMSGKDGGDHVQRLSDQSLVKLFRVIRLARRLLDLEASA